MATAIDPCEGCPAPCCQMQMIPHHPPGHLAWIDVTRFQLLFTGTELAIMSSGDFRLIRWQQCGMFLADKCRCSVHNTVRQPDICKTYSSHNCWYKRNFVTKEPEDICRLNLERYERWVAEISLDRNGVVINYPDYTATTALVNSVPIHPIFEPDAALIKSCNG